MNKIKTKQMIKLMLLVGVFSAPIATFADADTTAAVRALQSSNEGNFSAVNSTLSAGNQDLDDIKNNSQSILDFMNQHMKNDELIRALINYEAAARINEYQYNQDLLFMAAPGSVWAVQAGKLVGNTMVGDAALKLVNSSMLSSLRPYSLAGNFTGPLANGSPGTLELIPAGTVLTKDNVYGNYISQFVTSGDTTGLTIFNLGQFMESNNLVKQKIAPEQSQQMINMVLDPFPGLDPSLQTQLASSKNNPSSLTGAAKEAIVDAIANNAILSVSISALSDIVARRTPGTDGNGNQLPQSVMETMDQYSAQRFTNPAWYTQISTASDTALLREIAHMQAYSSWMQFQQFRVLEQQMALLATMNSMMTKMNASMEQLNIQLEKASAEAQQTNANIQQQAAQCPAGQVPSGTGGCLCGSGSRAGQDAAGGCP
ncbi:MAG: hypothetical protein JSS07_03430 [Proteobacteria bacterium]|nr:hypothetical protein [Pseudomonadota bacterium]